MFLNPPGEELKALLQKARTIAVVGVSPRPERPSHRIARRLKDWGYRIIPVRPGIDSVLGEKAYAKLRDVPVPVDIVDVTRFARVAGPEAAPEGRIAAAGRTRVPPQLHLAAGPEDPHKILWRRAPRRNPSHGRT